MRLSRFLRRPRIAAVLRGGMRYIFGKRGQRRVYSMRLYYRVRMLVLVNAAEPIAKLTGTKDMKLWVDGREAFPRLERLIRKARFTIVIQMFIWKDDDTGRTIARRLVEAADRGVQIDITKEAVGDVFEIAGDFMGTKKSQHVVWKRFWTHPRIRITYGTDHDHAKVYVFDDQVLVLTGMNISDEYLTWHDYLVELQGRVFVEQYLARKSAPPNSAVRLVMNTEEEKGLRRAVTDLLRSAKRVVVVEHCYLSDPEVIDELIALSKRQIRVTVILPDRPDFHHHANMTSVGRMLTEGNGFFLHVLVYPGMIHSKILLVDFEHALLGSANLMKSSLDDMGEVNVLVHGKQRAMRTLQESLRMDIFRSRPLSSMPHFLWLSKWLAWLGL